MAIGITEVKTTGRLIFDLQRGTGEAAETTSRSIDIAYPITDEQSETLQASVDWANSTFTDSSNQMNIFIQPANWRDMNIAEEQWTTTGVRYEIVTTTTTPITPETPVTLGSAQEYHEQGQEQQG